MLNSVTLIWWKKKYLSFLPSLIFSMSVWIRWFTVQFDEAILLLYICWQSTLVSKKFYVIVRKVILKNPYWSYPGNGLLCQTPIMWFKVNYKWSKLARWSPPFAAEFLISHSQIILCCLRSVKGIKMVKMVALISFFRSIN